MAKVYRFQGHEIDGTPVNKRFTTRKLLEAYKHDLKRRRELKKAGIPSSALRTGDKGTTLLEWFRKWSAGRHEESYPANTLLNEEGYFRLHVNPFLGNRTLSSITSEEAEEFFKKLKIRKSNVTHNRVRAMLHKMYEDARRKKLVDQNPISTIERLAEKKPLIANYLERDDDIRALILACDEENAPLGLAVRICLYAGLRSEEVLALQWGDLHFDTSIMIIKRVLEAKTNTIHLNRTKAGEFRETPALLPPELSEVLLPLKSDDKSSFVVTENGTHLTYGQLQKRFKKVVDKLGLRITLHGLRHTFASHFIIRGGSLTHLKEAMGHSSISVTERYKHLPAGFYSNIAQSVSYTKPAKKQPA